MQGKPNNYNTKNCESMSSDCVIYDGKNISCLVDLCRGDSITTVTYELAKKVCDILDQLDISEYDLSCIETLGGVPSDFKSFINLLITKVCATANPESAASITSSGCGECIVNFTPAFYYNDPSSGDEVTSGPIEPYVQRIGIAVGTLITQIAVNQRATSNLGERVSILENTPAPVFQLPELAPTGIADPNVLLPIDEFLKELEIQFVALREATGDTTDIYNSITTPPSDFNAAKALGTTGGVMGTLPGWVQDPASLSDSLTNAWLTILDLRSAVRNIQLNMNTACEGIELALAGTLENKILKLFFTGIIPTNLSPCQTAGALFRVSDDSGNYFNTTVDIKNNMNNSSGVTIDLNSTSLNFADNLKISSAVVCFADSETGTTCNSYLEVIVNNNLNCPTLNVIPSANSVAFNFTHTSGTLTYAVQLFNSSNEMVQSQNYGASSPETFTGGFSSLVSDTFYKIRIQMITLNNTKSCPFVSFNTPASSCPAPISVTSMITY